MFPWEHFHFSNSPKTPRIGFERTGTEYWKEWERYLTIDGKKAFHLGNICDTCHFLFSKLGDSNIAPPTKEISTRLEKSKDVLDTRFLDLLGQILPADDFFVACIRVKPQLTHPGDKLDYFSKECPALFAIGEYHGPCYDVNTPYYRDSGTVFAKDKLLINFMIPLHDPGELSHERVAYFSELLEKGHVPTAFAISVLDIEAPAIPPAQLRQENISSESEHWCLAHYLLDGHHKIHAAAKADAECAILCFISRKESFGGDDALYTLGETLTQQSKQV